MARVKDIINQWGRQSGPNPQRSDLWQVDLSALITGLNTVQSGEEDGIFLPDMPRYFSASVSIPEQKIKAEPVRRDSCSYNMPGWDEPLEAFKFTFILDDGGNQSSSATISGQSTLYTLFTIWRAVVRSGRGAVGNESSFVLNANYTLDYAYPIYIYLLKGQAPPGLSSLQAVIGANTSNSYNTTFQDSNDEAAITRAQLQSTGSDFSSLAAQMGLDISGIYRLENAWLSSFKMADLSYEGAKVHTIEASIYADNLLQVWSGSSLTSFV